MGLSVDLLSQFAKVTNDANKKDKTPSTVYGTVVGGGVQLDGSNTVTPVSTTVDMKEGDRVIVMIKNHSATVTGNLNDPSASSKNLQKNTSDVTDLGIAVADRVTTDQLNTAKANITKELTAADATIRGELVASIASVEEKLTAKDVEIEGKVSANEGEITKLKTNKLDVEAATATYATIENLKVTNAKVNNLEATHVSFENATAENFKAVNASIEALDVENLNATYAKIDFSNIGEAAIKQIFSETGMIKDLVVGDGTITGKLVGVTISGDLIEGNTVKADKLVVKGSDGLYYKLNVDAGATASTEVSEEDLQNGLHGTAIIAKTITAEKISVSDLVAFGATIGGFHITESSLYSGLKNSMDNASEGVYLDSTGQLAIGDSSNFIKYYKDTDGTYKLVISAVDDAAKTATNFMSYDAEGGLQVGNKTSGEWSGYRTQTTSESYSILDEAGNVLARYGSNLIELGQYSAQAVIKLCGDQGHIKYDDTEDYLELSGDKLRLNADTMASLYSTHLDGHNGDKTSINVSYDGIHMYSQSSIDLDPDTLSGHWTTSEFSLDSGNFTAIADYITETSRYGSVYETTTGDITLNPAGALKIRNNVFISANEKTGFKDGVIGWYLGKDGTAHVTHNSGATIAFHYAGSADLTSRIDESARGVISINGMTFGKNKILWSGGMYMQESHTIALSEAISAQTNGVVLVFSRYSSGAAKDYNWSTHFVPKAMVSNYNGGGQLFLMSSDGSFDVMASKYLYIEDEEIRGHANNTKTGTGACGITYANNAFVLRYVIGV
jgi:hypothetical protein